MTIQRRDTQKAVVQMGIESILGRTEDLHPKLVEAIEDIYFDFIPAYLGFFRKKNGLEPDWQPSRFALDLGLVEEMRHFFSDYQEMTNRFLSLNRSVQHLRSIDRGREPTRYEAFTGELLGMAAKELSSEAGGPGQISCCRPEGIFRRLAE